MTGPSAPLPARDFEEIRLAEALERGRCPLCDARQEASFAALRGLAREGATDRGLRAQMDKGLGFCPPHSLALSKMELLQTSSQLATAVLLDAVLRRRLAAFDKIAGGDAAQQRSLSELADPRCPVCTRIGEASAGAADRLLRLSADPAWAAALGASEICLEDLYALWGAALAAPREFGRRWSEILAVQRKRLGELQKTLAEYAHNSTMDRRGLITREQQEAGAAAIRFFAGTPDRDRNR
jgi:hypothetical protein